MQEVQQSGEKVDAYQKPTSSCQPGSRAFKRGRFKCVGGRRPLHAEQQSALTVVLELIMQWSDQRLLDYFRYNSSSAPGSVCSHLLESSS